MRRQERGKHPKIRDYGCEPFIFNINHATNMNENFRIALWTGQNLQLTLMSIPVRGEIGTEMHSDVDQFIKIQRGRAKIYMGNHKNCMQEVACIDEDYAILIPRGTWHNVVNVCNRPLKLYSLYAPPQHPFGTVYPTKEEAERGCR